MERRTLLAAGGGALLALGGGFVIAPRGNDTPVSLLPGAANAQETTGELPEVLEMIQGDPDAAVEVIEYASFTCPHCASFHANQYKALKANYLDTGKIRFVYREVFFDRPGLWASMIARCPDDADFFFNVANLLYEQQRSWLAGGDPGTIVEALRTLAKTAGLDDATLDACLADAPKAESLFTWYQENAERDTVTSTPSFLIDGAKHGNMSYEDFAAILDAKLS